MPEIVTRGCPRGRIRLSNDFHARRFHFAVLDGLALLCAPSSLCAQHGASAVRNELLVKFKTEVSAARREAILGTPGAQLVRRFDGVGIEHIRLPEGVSAQSIAISNTCRIRYSMSKTQRSHFIRFANGAIVHLETSWAANLPDDIPMGQYFGREPNNSTIYGTSGTIRLKPLTLFEDRSDTLETVSIDLPDETDSSSFNFGISPTRSAAAPAVKMPRQALPLMELIDAIYASSSLGREVPIV